jgi:hypothetical protein
VARSPSTSFAISSREKVSHPGIRKPIGGSIRDEPGSGEAAQAVDRAEPQEPAGVADDAADTGVRAVVFDRVDTNWQPLGVRCSDRDEKQPRKRT